MEIIQVDLNKDYGEAIKKAINILNYGGTIVYPTDTLYSIGANALNDIAVRKIFKIKNRDLSKPFPVLARNMQWVKEMAQVSKKNEGVLAKMWPGKVTAILPKKDVIPDAVTSGEKNIGIRIPDFVFVDKFLGKYGYPIVSTPANVSGDEPTNDINKIIGVFENRVNKPDLIIDVGILPKSDPSLVVDLTGERPKVLRVGPSKPQELLKLLNI